MVKEEVEESGKWNQAVLLKQIKHNTKLSIWRSSYLIVMIFPSICFQKLEAAIKMHIKIASSDSRKETPSQFLSEQFKMCPRCFPSEWGRMSGARTLAGVFADNSPALYSGHPQSWINQLRGQSDKCRYWVFGIGCHIFKYNATNSLRPISSDLRCLEDCVSLTVSLVWMKFLLRLSLDLKPFYFPWRSTSSVWTKLDSLKS